MKQLCILTRAVKTDGLTACNDSRARAYDLAGKSKYTCQGIPFVWLRAKTVSREKSSDCAMSGELPRWHCVCITGHSDKHLSCFSVRGQPNRIERRDKNEKRLK